MAAADYFASGTRPAASYLSPPQPHRTSSQPNMIFNPPPQFSYPSPLPQPTTPQYHPPPPYGDEPKPNVHFAPPPIELQAGRHSFSELRPNQHQFNPQYFTQAPAQIGQYRPQGHNYPPRPAPHMRPYVHPNESESSFTSGYSSDPEPHRRHSKQIDKKNRRISETSRSTVADGFIGAAGGGLIGDLIFPGLGTAAGALAGWLGGKDYGEHRKARELKRDRAEEVWQKKHGSRGHSYEPRRRSRDHSKEPRRRSADYGGEGGRRRSHDGRKGGDYR